MWYGSLRGGIEFSGGNTDFYDGASRWGIKGSAEASEGLTAVYRFEHKFSTSDAGQDGGRLAYVGLSGGFGTLTMGQIWSASYNHAGVIRDFPNWYTSPDTSARVGNALSYSVSNDAFSMQIDAIMDGKKNTGGAVDQLEFGMTVNVGEVGKVALAHTTVKDETVTKMTERIPAVPGTPGTPGTPATPYIPASPEMYFIDHDDDDETDDVEVKKITVMVPPDHAVYTENGAIKTSALTDDNLRNTDDGSGGANGIVRTATGFHVGDINTCSATDATTPCLSFTAYVHTAVTTGTGVPPTSVAGGGVQTPGAAATYTDTYYAPDAADADADDVRIRKVDAVDEQESMPGTAGTAGTKGTPEVPPMPYTATEYGYKASHISAEFGLGAITTAVGYSEKKMNNAVNKTKTTFIGAKGGIGDTGLSWGAYSRVKDNADGTKEKPWTIGLSKSLGGGAWAYIEHHNDGDGGDASRSTAIALGVSF